MLHAHRVCGIVERHRKRLVETVAADSMRDLDPAASPGEGSRGAAGMRGK